MKGWRIAVQEPEASLAMARAFGIPQALGQALLNRGLRTVDDADRFLRPRLSRLSDPFDLPGVEAAAERLVCSARLKEQVAVFGDYDVDGITGTALLVRVLERLGARVRALLPDRVRDGYGFGVSALERCLSGDRADLIVTVDCGTNACEEARLAREAGVDLVITDHHAPGDLVPEALAVVNPRYASVDEWRDLAGVGVAFKVAHAVLKLARAEGLAGADALDLRQYLDWVALGTVADAVPLRGENRVLVRYGLDRASRAPSPGVAALCSIAGIEGALDAWHFGYLLGPRLNAAGRMASADEALALLLSSDGTSADRLALRLDRLNRERQRIEGSVLEAALAQAGEGGAAWSGRVAAGAGWHPGIIGIVASRLCMHFGQPSIVVSLEPDGGGRGSGRAPEGFNLLGVLAGCSEHLVRFGGHAAAAGLEVKPGRMDAFREAFAAEVRGMEPAADSVCEEADAELGLAGADDAMADALDAFRPFGRANEPPLWLARGVHVASSKTVGAGRHLRLQLAEGGVERSAIGFQLGARGEPPSRIDVLFEVERNTFAGRTTVQLKLRDWRPSEA